MKNNGFNEDSYNSIISDLEKIFDGEDLFEEEDASKKPQKIVEENPEEVIKGIFDEVISNYTDNSFVMEKPLMKKETVKKPAVKTIEKPAKIIKETKEEKPSSFISVPLMSEDDIVSPFKKNNITEEKKTEPVKTTPIIETNIPEVIQEMVTETVIENKTVEETKEPDVVEDEVKETANETNDIFEVQIIKENETTDETKQTEEVKEDVSEINDINIEEIKAESEKEKTESVEDTSKEEEIDEETEELFIGNKKSSSKRKKIDSEIVVSSILIAMLVLAIVLVALKYFVPGPAGSEANKEEISGEVNNVASKTMDEELRKFWLDNKKTNKDYVGEILFDSGIVSESFVQAKSVVKENGEKYVFYTKNGDPVYETDGYIGNDVYQYMDWRSLKPIDAQSGTGTSTYLDCDNNLSDQLLVIYGFNWNSLHPGQGYNLSNLEMMKQPEYYSTGADFKIVLDNQIRKYEVCSVFEINMFDQRAIDLLLNRRITFTDIDFINENALYDTGIYYSDKDLYVLLVLNEYDVSSTKLCLLAKENYREIYE